MKNTFITAVVVAVIALLVIGIIAAMDAGCGAGEDGKAALEADGFTNVELGERAWWGCARDDSFNSHFTATNPAGKRVEGLVCCGSLGKGCTVRF